MYVIESTLEINLSFFSISTNINKIWKIEIDVCAMFKIKYGLSRMHSTIITHQVGWFEDKGIDIHPWGLKIQTSQVT